MSGIKIRCADLLRLDSLLCQIQAASLLLPLSGFISHVFPYHLKDVLLNASDGWLDVLIVRGPLPSLDSLASYFVWITTALPEALETYPLVFVDSV